VTTQITVLVEADQMADMGKVTIVKKILITQSLAGKVFSSQQLLIAMLTLLCSNI
jgi:hypothetical protein